MDNWIPNVENFFVVDGHGKVIGRPTTSKGDISLRPPLRGLYIPTTADLLNLRDGLDDVVPMYKNAFDKDFQKAKRKIYLRRIYCACFGMRIGDR
jgi:hypothetical protein